MADAALDVPEAGQLVRVRGQQWVVAGVRQSQQPADELAASRLPGRTLVQLTSVSDDDLGEELTLVWEVEPGREIVPATSLPEVSEDGWDDPQRLGAFLDAVRWGTAYAMTYDGVNRLTKVEEDNPAGTAVHTTTYGYDAAGNLTSRGHDAATSAYTYDPRNLLATETDKTSATDPSPQATTFTYTPDLLRKTEVKPNGNTVSYAYFADQLLQNQTETTNTGTLVAQHAYTYNPDGVKASDAAKLMNADNTSAYLTHTLGYSYDPRDWLTQVTTDGAATESYVHDATGNVISQTINGTQTTYNYDRDRLMSAAAGGAVTAYYNYDPLGRLDTVTTPAGTQLEANTYDGFDRIVSHTAGTTTISYTYDPLSRLTSQAVTGGTTTQYAYLGLSSQLITETPTSGPSKSYTYTPYGERISQTSTSGGTTTTGYYTYNDHSDVEAVTGAAGTPTAGLTTATYGYTAYGQPVASQFTGADKNNTQPGAAVQPYSAYRFNAMRWDSTSGQYDMGFRNYAPGLNQFLSRDMYNGALADMSLATDPFTGNRYTFGGGNPITNIELDGHMFPAGGGSPPPNIYRDSAQRGFTIIEYNGQVWRIPDAESQVKQENIIARNFLNKELAARGDLYRGPLRGGQSGNGDIYLATFEKPGDQVSDLIRLTYENGQPVSATKVELISLRPRRRSER
jgi:RHS repeat-associated protein